MSCEPGPIALAAVEYAKQGWHVIPLHGLVDDGGVLACTCRQGVACASPGKHPRHSTWQRNASNDPETVAGTWAHYGELANVGIVAGPSGLDIVDIDGPEGMRAFAAVMGGELPDGVPTVKTGRGYHLYFAADPSQPMRPAVGDGELKGLDLRSGNSFVVAPPSLHASGGRYEWIESPVSS